jgi:hypothetical protein
LWNFDVFYEMLRMVNAYGYIGLGGWPSEIMQGFLAANGGGIVDGSSRFVMGNSAGLNALAFTRDVFEDDYNRKYSGNDAGGYWWDITTSYLNGTTAFWHTWLWMFYQDIPFEWTWVPYPDGPSGTGRTYFKGIEQGWSIPAAVWVEDAADAFFVFTEFQKWHGGDYGLRNYDGLEWPRSIFKTQRELDRWFAFSEWGGTVDLGNVATSGYSQLSSILDQIGWELYDGWDSAVTLAGWEKQMKDIVESVLYR